MICPDCLDVMEGHPDRFVCACGLELDKKTAKPTDAARAQLARKGRDDDADRVARRLHSAPEPDENPSC